MIDRDPAHERQLVELAARAAGTPNAVSILSFAQARMLDGGIRPRSIEQWRQEIREELADAVNYCCWTILAIRAAFDAGEQWACDLYVQTMGALVGVLIAWDALHRQPS